MKVLFLVFVFISFSIVSFSQIEYPDSIAVTTVISDPDSVKTDKMELFNGTTLDVHIKNLVSQIFFIHSRKVMRWFQLKEDWLKQLRIKQGRLIL